MLFLKMIILDRTASNLNL